MCARKWDWFDDFMVMKMMEEDEKENQPEPSPIFQQSNTMGYTEDFDDEEEQSEEEIEELLEALNEEMSNLESELYEVRLHEPLDAESSSYERWKERQDLLEWQLGNVMDEIKELED